MYEFTFQGRKPSNAQVLKKVNEGINLGNRVIEINWGENQILLQKIGGHKLWYGVGWIKNISGADIATKLNDQRDIKKFLNEHIQFVKVGF